LAILIDATGPAVVVPGPEASREVGLTERSVFRQLERLKSQLTARYRD